MIPVGAFARVSKSEMFYNLDSLYTYMINNKALIGVMLLTDGMLTKTNQPRMTYFSNDMILHNKFQTLINTTYNTSITSFFAEKNGHRTIYARKEHLSVMDDLLKLSPSFKTSPGYISKEEYCNKPQPTLSFLDKCNRKTKIAAINIAMSAEGSIEIIRRENGSIKGVLKLACSHPALVEEWRALFSEFRIKFNIMKDRNIWSGIHGLRTTRSDYILKFYELGGFVNKVKIHRGKRFKNVEKNRVLEAFVKFKKAGIKEYTKLDDQSFWRYIGKYARVPERH